MASRMAQFILRWYVPGDDKVTGEEHLPDLTAHQIRDWFHLVEGDTRYDPRCAASMDSYIVQVSQRQHLAFLTKHQIDLNRFDYFLDCEWPKL